MYFQTVGIIADCLGTIQIQRVDLVLVDSRWTGLRSAVLAHGQRLILLTQKLKLGLCEIT